MRKATFILLYNIAFLVCGKTQCTFENIFPVKHGISKFKATTTISSIKNLTTDEEANLFSGITNSWDKPKYLNGDSVFKSSISFNYIFNNCFIGDKNKLCLRFVDDKLYKIEITLMFSKTKIEQCLENYNLLVGIFKNNFKVWDEFVDTNGVTKEQKGEGYWFYPTYTDKRNKVKIEQLSIGFNVEYERKWSDYSKDWHQTGNVENYTIEISYVNLKGTKLTNKGF